MNGPPDRPKLYHITHVENLPAIVRCGCIGSHAECDRRQLGVRGIGFPELERRRLEQAVTCHPGTTVGEYVPFYFGARSVMLFVLHCGNHPGLCYRGGQRPIVHFQVDLHAVIDWAEAEDRRWAFTPRNAGAAYAEFYRSLDDLDRIDWAEAEDRRWAFTPRNAGAAYAEFYRSLDDLDRIDWAAVHARDFRDPTVKEHKQAEFLVYGLLPWRLVEKVGVIDREMRQRVLQALAGSAHRPKVSVESKWYY